MSDDYYNYWISARSWTYNRNDPTTGNFTEEYRLGVEGFIEFASNQPSVLESTRCKFYCSCRKCKCAKLLPGGKISDHILGKGFMPGYYIWFRHGEELNVDIGSSHDGGDNNFASGSTNYQEDYVSVAATDHHLEVDRTIDMVNDAFNSTMNPGYIYQNEEGYYNENPSGPNAEAKNLYDMLEAARNPLYEVMCSNLD